MGAKSFVVLVLLVIATAPVDVGAQVGHCGPPNHPDDPCVLLGVTLQPIPADEMKKFRQDFFNTDNPAERRKILQDVMDSLAGLRREQGQ